MKLAVFGATGALGRNVIKEACTRKYEVTALVRSPEKLNDLKDHPNLTIKKVDISSDPIESIHLNEYDAVISCLGHAGIPIRPITLYSDTIKRIIEAMKAAHKRRLVVCSASFSKPFLNEYPYVFYRLFLRPMIGRHLDDMYRMEQILEAESDIDYTIVRPGHLLNKDPVSDFKRVVREGYYNPDSKRQIPRSELAKFMIDEAQEAKFVKKGVTIDEAK
ncbi:hypothetical protein ACOME3_005411 [Neoechinorhynchus agilis]